MASWNNLYTLSTGKGMASLPGFYIQIYDPRNQLILRGSGYRIQIYDPQLGYIYIYIYI